MDSDASPTAANQSRHRTEASPDINDKEETETDAPTVHSSSSIFQPLETKPACTRFVQIERAESDDAPIVCKLVHRAFETRPRFKALSYMWGDVEGTKTILLNGQVHHVGDNLWDALRQVRQVVGSQHQYGEPEPLFWIDALCINQSDVDERSRQVRLMGDIYFRASKVIVWLGSRYSCYQEFLSRTVLQQLPLHVSCPRKVRKAKTLGFSDRITGPDTSISVLGRSPSGFQSDSSVAKTWPSIPTTAWVISHDSATDAVVPKEQDIEAESSMHSKVESALRKMGEALATDEYWNRLWIIQELGQAREIDVYFGTWVSPWNEFVGFLVRLPVSSRRLVHLDSQLRRETSVGHTLKSLLMGHQDALCKDPRDKVYGLVGLAADASHFPINYSKSLVQVWSDTMEYMARNQLLESTEVIVFGRLVKTLLMGDPCITETSWLSLSAGKEPIQIPAFIWGWVRTVGPSTSEVVSDPDTVDEWKSAIYSNYKEQLGTATKESTALIRSVLDSSETTLAQIDFTHTCDITWDVKQLNHFRRRNYYATTSPASNVQVGSKTVGAKDFSRCSPHLYQLEFRKIPSPDGAWPMMGIASGSIKVGDALCRISHTKRAIVVRWEAVPNMNLDPDEAYDRMSMVGTATVSNDINAHGDQHPEIPAGGPWQGSGQRQRSAVQPVFVDARTLYALLS